jgi:cell division transport system ATP-binding protein
VIHTTHLSKSYGRGVYALRDVTLHVEKGDFLFLTGASGAGKSTFLRLLLRQELPTDGKLTVGGRNLAALSLGQVQAYRRTVGFVFQDFQVLKWVGLQHRANAYPVELSGGEQQRVAIARALVNEPSLILADEPTGNLDPDLALEIMNLFRDINAAGTTVLVATHDRELINRVGRRTLVLDHGHLAEGA